MANCDWLLYCRTCGEWTGLHRFLEQRGHFQGEHSLTLNAHLESDLLLGKFLIHHADHELVPIADQSTEYTRIIFQKERFLESLIDHIVAERILRDRERESQLQAERQQGYEALHLLKKLYTERLAELDQQHPDEPSQAKVHLGKSLGIEWCGEQIAYFLSFEERA
jgi:hypothetical protein